MRSRPFASGAVALMLVGACSSTPARRSTTTRGTGSASSSPSSVATVQTTSTTRVPRHLVIEPAPFSLPRPSARAALVPDGKQLVLLGGLDGTRRTTNEILRVDPATHTVSRAGALVIAVHDTAGAAVAGSPMTFGGGSSGETAAVQQAASDGSATVIGQLPVPRSDVAAATVDGRTFLVGGFDGTRLRPTVIATTDGRTFQTLGDLPTPVRYAAVAPLGTNIYVVGGTTTGNASGAVHAVQAIDTATGRVREVGTLPHAITDAVAATIDDHVYVIGGIVDGNVSAVVWRLEIGSSGAGPVALMPVGALPTPTADAAAAVVDGVAYVVGGESPVILDSVVVLTLR